MIVGVDAFTKAMHDSQGRSASTISGITAVDELTTTFRLSEPDGSFLRALAMAWAFIRPVSTPHAITDLPPPFVGPYRLSSHHEGRTATIDREPSWAANVVAGVPEDAAENNIDGVDIEIGVAPDIQLLRIKGNQLDLTLNDSVVVGSDVPAIANDPQYADRFFSTPTAGVYFGIFRVDRPPFEDPRLRQAVNLAIDRAQLVKIRGGEIAASPWSQILPANFLADEPVDVYPATPDVEGAKRLVASTGLDTPIKFTLVIESSRTAVPADAQSVKEALAAVGFDVALQVPSARRLWRLRQRPDVRLRSRVRELGSGLSGRDHVLQPASDLSRRNARPGQLGEVLRRGFRFGRRHDQPAPARS